MLKGLNYFLQQMTQLKKQREKQCCLVVITTYRILKGLTGPSKPADKTFSDLVSLMKDHQNLKKTL